MSKKKSQEYFNDEVKERVNLWKQNYLTLGPDLLKDMDRQERNPHV